MTKPVKIKIILLLFNINCLFAQEIQYDSTLWDSVPLIDLSMNRYTPDTSAEAVVLLDNGLLKVSMIYQKCILSVHHRVKILKKSAFETYGNHTIPIRNYEKLISIRAHTINPDGSRTNVSEFFDEKLNEFVKIKKFAFPKLQEGSIIEYEYIIESENLLELYPWRFQEVIPVRHSQLLVKIPPKLDYVFLQKGERKLKQDIVGFHSVFEDRNEKNSYIDSFYRFQIDTVEALKPEGYITTMNDYILSLKFQLSEIKSFDSNEKPRKILTDWKSLTKDFLEDKSLGEQLSKRGRYKNVWNAVKPLLEKVSSPEEKIRICYEYISKNVSWIENDFRIYADESLEEAFKKKRANSGELNMMLIACLNEADIKAYPMLISTRDNGQPYKQYPIRKQFNHLVCYVESDKIPMILDAGNIFRPMNCPRIPSLNGAGFVLDAKNPRWVDIVAPLSTQTVLMNCSLSSDGVLTGKINESHTGYSGVDERTSLKDDDKNENVKKAWTSIFSEFKINSVELINKDSMNLPFKRNISFTIPEAATISNDLLYIKPTLKTDFDQSLLKQSTRNYPVDMPYPIRDNFVLNLELPKDFIVEELPKDIKITLPNDGGSYVFSSTLKENALQLRARVEIKQLHYTKEEYGNVKRFFDMIAAKQGEQIVLKKKMK
jgi:Domain of Unknown Function with PDB structure (DUF3857)